ncbi:hypothetical protein IG631_05009 [Alternaria alternata]|nr:hypothetical protein IG631_05009 [Alternaria alternata]
MASLYGCKMPDISSPFQQSFLVGSQAIWINGYMYPAIQLPGLWVRPRSA